MKGILKTAAVLWAGVGMIEAVSADATGLFVGKFAEGSEMDRLWSVPVLYQNKKNPVIQ